MRLTKKQKKIVWVILIGIVVYLISTGKLELLSLVNSGASGGSGGGGGFG